MQDTPLHFYSQHANKTLNWVGTDQPQRINDIKNDPLMYQQWLQSGWNEQSTIEYKFNEFGFREDTFDQSPRIAIFGSSQTVGVGLHRDQTWTHQFSVLTNAPVWNLATGSGALDTCYRTIKYYIERLNIKAVILAIPEDNKFEYWLDSNNPSLISDTQYSNYCLQTISNTWYSNENNKTLNRVKNLEAISYICDCKNIPLIKFELADANKYKHLNPMDWSRCLCHVGPNYHKNIAKFVVDKLWPTVNTPWH